MAAGDVLSATRIGFTALIVITPLVAAAWLPAGVPYLLRQLLLCGWGVGAIAIASRQRATGTYKEALRAVGFTRPQPAALLAACLVSLPMWVFLPVMARRGGVQIEPRSDWLTLLAGVVLVNGIAEEVIHRGFVFAQLRRERSFALAATLSAAVFAAQHLYIVLTAGWVIGLAAVLLAALLSYPFAFVFERGRGSILPTALLHTSSNAPVLIFAMPDELIRAVVLPHMVVVLVSLYLLFTPVLIPRRKGNAADRDVPGAD